MGVSGAPCDAPNAPVMGASDIPHDVPMLFFDNLVKFFSKNYQKKPGGI